MEVKEKIGELMFTALPYEDFLTELHMGWLIPLVIFGTIALTIGVYILNFVI